MLSEELDGEMRSHVPLVFQCNSEVLLSPLPGSHCVGRPSRPPKSLRRAIVFRGITNFDRGLALHKTLLVTCIPCTRLTSFSCPHTTTPPIA